VRKYIIVTYIVKPDEDQYAAYCPELGTASCGDTIEEALDNIKDAVSLHIETLKELGDLERFLAGRGVKPLLRYPRQKQQAISVPKDALAMAHVVSA
jgi:predicted RNase H-like HicB family nuclease